MSPDDVIRLRHMAEAAEAALRFCRGRTPADVESDDMLRFALTRAVEIIGEAANKVSAEARAQMPGIAWPAIVGMRNRLEFDQSYRVYGFFINWWIGQGRASPRH